MHADTMHADNAAPTTGKIAHIKYNRNEKTWFLYVDGRQTLKSADVHNGGRNLQRAVENKSNAKLRSLGVTEYVMLEADDPIPNQQIDPDVFRQMFEAATPGSIAKSATATPSSFTSISQRLNEMFSAEERFSFLANAVRATAYQVHDFGDPELKLSANPMAILCGSGGIGKSFTTKETLDSLGVKRVELDTPSDFDEFQTSDERETKYVIIGGYSTAKALYRALYTFREGAIIVLDDCDAALKDSVSVDLLKNACDSSDNRRVSWNSEMRQSDDLPRSFEFRSSVIVITNLPMDKIPQPLRSRAKTVDVTLRRDEVVERISSLVYNSKTFLPEFDMHSKIIVLDWLKDQYDTPDMKALVPNLNLRCFRQAAAAYKQHNGNAAKWQREALYNMASANT